MSDLLPSDPASWRRHAAHALASFASPRDALVWSVSSNLATPPRSAISLQMSSFTATCLRAVVSEAHRTGSSDASTAVSETHRADAAPALANALACVNAPDAGSLGSSPVVRALTAAHAWRSARASEAASTNTATSDVSTPLHERALARLVLCRRRRRRRSNRRRISDASRRTRARAR